MATKLVAGTSVLDFDLPKGELLILLVEEVCVLAVLGIQIALLVEQWGREGRVDAIAQVAEWSYITALTSLRLVFSASHSFWFSRLWYHTGLLYTAQWVLTLLIFRSEMIHPHSNYVRALTSSYFALNTVLALIAGTSRKGNQAVNVEYEGDLKPAQEPLASVLSSLTFAWVDAVVCTGYKKTYEMSDVWNLPGRDKAAAILADYRQVKRTNILAFHLLKYFREDLLIQAAWASVSGLITFVPTLLLKAILEYVENPGSVPQNAAWFYVILLFVSGVVNALSSGQALWKGGNVCIRLRAIIIGEIYGKALRRRAAASPDKVLGEEQPKASDGEPEKSWIKKITTLRRKTKAEDKKTGANEKSEDSQVPSGTIINLMAVDSFKVAEISAYLHLLWAETPVQLVLAVVLLYQILGYSSIVGIAMMSLLLPVNTWVAKQFASSQKKILAATDARIHTTNEVLINIRIIKYFAWEQRFLGNIEEKRVTELRHLRNRYIILSIATTIWSGAPIVITFLTFLVYTAVEKKDLIPSVAFTALSLFSLLRIPLDQLAYMVAHAQESKVSVDRVEEYLNEPETDKYRQLQSDAVDLEGEPLIGFDNGTFSWANVDSDGFKMINLDVHFKVGQVNVIIGPTGSGKTSMLMALLGEMSLVDGSVYLPGGKCRGDLRADSETGLTESVAYCAQQAWLVNGTIRENIVFASPWDAERYHDVIVASSLQRDLEVLDSGDQTLVGEKGISLSGGQKQRISLARALYCNARHVLLDDVLSAVDSHTAKWIFDNALLGPLMYNRTCILVTHNAVLCLPQAAYAVVLDNGRISAQGTAQEVISSGTLHEDISKLEPKPASRGPSRVPLGVGDDGMEAAVDTELHSHEPNGIPTGDAPMKVPAKDMPGMNSTVEHAQPDEKKSTGAIKFRMIFMYLRSMGGWFYWMVAGISFTLQQLSQVSTNAWIRQWANAYAGKEVVSTMGVFHNQTDLTYVRSGVGSSFSCLRSGSCVWNIPALTTQDPSNMNAATTSSQVDAAYYLGVYAVLGVAYMCITLFREGVLFSGSIGASKRIHRQLIESITRARFRFFDTTPLGRIMNRFSKDIEVIDQEVALVAVDFVHCLFSLITIIILISAITPGFLIAGFFIMIIYFLIGRFYISSSRDLKRLESIQRSPLYQQFGETMSGTTTIRAYGDERRFIRENLDKINTHSRPFIYLSAANRWLAFRVDVVGALVSFFAGAFVVTSVGKIDAGAAGLAMTYAVTFTENVLWFVRLYSSNEQNMNSVERIKEYLDVDQEAALIVENDRPAANWPSKGSVEFVEYTARYRSDLDPVLKNITFTISPGEKVGVVGRTGAGKSTLALALFRALEAEQGKILIDDVDISLIGLQDLRENIVMVPQDPTLFTGTLRTNLDPFGLFTDEEIFTALRGVQLISGPSVAQYRPETPVQAVRKNNKRSPASSSTAGASITDTSTMENKNIFRNLSSTIAESGSNISQGQRQLLCLARALLKAPKVLLMDEATASIDYATDARIQETIREIDYTTVTIAHRLETIIDYDKVLVLDKGEIVEFGDPFDLISKADGVFHGMCEMSGNLEGLEYEAKRARIARNLVDDL